MGKVASNASSKLVLGAESSNGTKAAANGAASGANASIKKMYNCSDFDLYAVARQAWNYYDAAQPVFVQYNTTFTRERSTGARARIAAAEAMPGQAMRKRPSRSALADMRDMKPDIIKAWQTLEFAIQEAFPSTADIELKAAGYAYYLEALDNQWGNVESLIVTLNEYLGSNQEKLVLDGGLPATFAADFFTLGQTFVATRQQKISTTGTAKVGRNDKQAASNAVYKEVMKMMNMGKIIYRKNKAELWKYTFERLLNEVRGKHPASLVGVVADAEARVPLAGAIVTALLLDDALIATEYSATSDAKGRYEIKLQGGNFKVGIQAAGYEPYMVEERRLRPGVKSRLSVGMRKGE